MKKIIAVSFSQRINYSNIPGFSQKGWLLKVKSDFPVAKNGFYHAEIWLNYLAVSAVLRTRVIP